MNVGSESIGGKRVIVVDDHRNIRLTLAMTLEAEGAIVTQAVSYSDALVKLDESIKMKKLDQYDLILLDIRLPDGNGLDILTQLASAGLSSRVIMISGEGTTSDAFKATQLGAFDYVEKPFSPERILVSVDRCLDFNRIQNDNENLEKKLRKGNEIIGSSEKIKELISVIKRIAPTNGRVLIMGESGTGKELVSREIHRCSSRAKKELVKINCAAIPANLIESELFGHEKGAFTGAIKTRRGLFERADGATLFLDEIGELELGVQAKLLRVLQSGEMTRVGSEKTIAVDARVIAATNRDLAEMVEEGTFREDLFYRLNVISLSVPPLRERREDIPELANAFLEQACDEHSLGERCFSNEALNQLMAYKWPGNIRELKNLVERIAIMSEDVTIAEIDEIGTLPGDSNGLRDLSNKGNETDKNEMTTDEFSFFCGQLPWQDFHQEAGKAFIKHTLKKAGGNVSEAARILCLERAYLHRLMRKLGVQRDVVVSD
ncbi:MAG: sigma-54 dependent transcriptional regulator [Bdellovibrionota bacterium]